MADEVGVPYQSFIKLDSRDCLANHRKVQIKWLQAVLRAARAKGVGTKEPDSNGITLSIAIPAPPFVKGGLGGFMRHPYRPAPLNPPQSPFAKGEATPTKGLVRPAVLKVVPLEPDSSGTLIGKTT